MEEVIISALLQLLQPLPQFLQQQPRRQHQGLAIIWAIIWLIASAAVFAVLSKVDE